MKKSTRQIDRHMEAVLAALDVPEFFMPKRVLNAWSLSARDDIRVRPADDNLKGETSDDYPQKATA